MSSVFSCVIVLPPRTLAEYRVFRWKNRVDLLAKDPSPTSLIGFLHSEAEIGELAMMSSFAPRRAHGDSVPPDLAAPRSGWSTADDRTSFRICSFLSGRPPVKLVVVKPLQVPAEDNMVRRSIRHSVGCVDRGVGAASPESSDIPFVHPLSPTYEISHLQPASPKMFLLQRLAERLAVWNQDRSRTVRGRCDEQGRDARSQRRPRSDAGSGLVARIGDHRAGDRQPGADSAARSVGVGGQVWRCCGAPQRPRELQTCSI